MISITESFVTALLVKTSFYGLYIATFGVYLRWLLFADEGWKLRKPLDWPMLIVAILIFTSSTMWLGAFARLTMGFVRGAKFDLFYTNAIGAVTIADAVMIYRCWKVYDGTNRSWLIAVFPAICWLGCLISFILVFYYNHQIIVLPTNLPHVLWAVNQSKKGHTLLYPCNAAITIYTTTAIIYRIMHDASKSGPGIKRLQRLCRILAEAGFLYTLTTIPPLVAFFLDSSYLIVLQVAEAVNFSMAGIAFNLVLIRVGQNRADARRSQLDFGSTDRRGLLSSGRHYRHPSSSTQDAEKGIISTTSDLSGRHDRHPYASTQDADQGIISTTSARGGGVQ
ncbi:hypothetical protein M378DRAFT_130805 [Amanita muscaria Koide BX008]|uniref:Integral membrane protein n=1 Tax=Amanita muscaria (strain Koide BX008) TaxID=946122 RepID=A0A0C2WFM1_AMAMK|nr:hypothetical protein M378DRAFT_130805 [Amanita muscaria Koide BX008]